MSIQRTAFAVTTEDLTYQVADSIPLAATVYRPEGPGPFAGVVSVHGGRWCAETRHTNAALDRALAQRGIVVMAIDFRLPPLARYPLPVRDINLAIRWFKRHAGRYPRSGRGGRRDRHIERRSSIVAECVATQRPPLFGREVASRPRWGRG